MPSPDPTGSAARVLGCALGMAALAGACSKQERPDVALRQSTLAAQTPATPAAPSRYRGESVPELRRGEQYGDFHAGGGAVRLQRIRQRPGHPHGAAQEQRLVINFVQDDGTPHSAEVQSGEGPVANSGGNPAIPRAYTNKVVEGLPQGATDVMKFSVAREREVPHHLRGARTRGGWDVDLDGDRSRGQGAELRADA